VKKTALTFAHLEKIWVSFAAFALVFAMINSAQVFASGQEVTLDEIKSSYHSIIIESPTNGSVYNDENQIPLNVTVDYIYTERYVPWRVLNRLFYSIDDEPAKILTAISGGFTTPIPYIYNTGIDISSLSNGLHQIRVIAEFSVDVSHVYVTNYNYSSSPTSFSSFGDQSPTPSPSPTATPSATDYTGVHPTEKEVIMIVAVAVAGICAGLVLLVYFKKHRH
jgi:hypothetical protein